MGRASASGSFGRPRRELAWLLLASLVVVAALVVVIADDHALSAQSSRSIIGLCIVAGGMALIGAIGLRALWRWRRSERSAAEEVAELRKNLLTAETVIKAEPQVLVFWEQGRGVRVMVHTLQGIAGLPHRSAELLKFGR